MESIKILKIELNKYIAKCLLCNKTHSSRNKYDIERWKMNHHCHCLLNPNFKKCESCLHFIGNNKYHNTCKIHSFNYGLVYLTFKNKLCPDWTCKLLLKKFIQKEK